MTIDLNAPVPTRRTAGLAVRVQGDETLVLDTITDTAHCLPADVARVWDACVAGRTVTEVASAAGVEPEVAVASIEQLVEVELLDVPKGIDRRRFLRRGVLAGAGVATLPLIQSVVAPAVMAAASLPKVATAVKTGCSTGNRLVYTLTLQNFTPNTQYFVTVAYKNGPTVTDPFTVTTDASGNYTQTGIVSGAAVSQDTTSITRVYSDAGFTNLVFTGATQVWPHC